MNTFTVEREVLIEALKEHRRVHLKEYKKAMKGWRKAVEKKIKEESERLEDPNEEVDLHFLSRLTKPQDFEEEYTAAIESLEWDTKEEVELDFNQMKQWARDQWGWSGAVAATNSLYTG